MDNTPKHTPETLMPGCNYHTTWQSHPAMRFVLDKVEGDIATLKTRITKKTFKTHVQHLIFIETEYNIRKFKRLKRSGANDQTNPIR